MARNPKGLPSNKPNKDENTEPYRLAKAAFEKIISDPANYDEIISQFAKDVEALDGNFLVGDAAFWAFKIFLKDIENKNLARNCEARLSHYAKLCHWRRLRVVTEGRDVLDVLVEMEELLARLPLQGDVRWAVEKVRKDSELQIESRKKRASIKAELRAIDEIETPGANATGKVDPAEGEGLIGKPRLTVDQFIMLMFAIGGSRFRGLDKNKVAEGLSALTGNTVKEFCKHFSEVLPTEKNGIKKFIRDPHLYNNDVKRVCEVLAKMGLTDEAAKLKESSGVS